MLFLVLNRILYLFNERQIAVWGDEVLLPELRLVLPVELIDHQVLLFHRLCQAIDVLDSVLSSSIS